MAGSVLGPGDKTADETKSLISCFTFCWERRTLTNLKKINRKGELLIRARKKIKQGDGEEVAWRVFVGWERSQFVRGR